MRAKAVFPLMNLADLLTSTASGGLFGGLLALGNTWISARIRKDERAHELEVLKVQGAMRVTGEEWSAFRASQEAAAADSSGPVAPVVAAIRSLTRPALTVGLLCASVAVYFSVPLDVRADVGSDILMLTGTALGWWFGSRPTLLSSRRK